MFYLFDGNILLNIIYQLIGIGAMVLSFVSYQKKDSSLFLLLQSISCALFAAQFLMTKAMTACIMNVICIFRCLFLSLNKNRKADFIFAGCIALCFIAAAIVSIKVFHENVAISLICLAGSLCSTIALTSKHYFITRYMQAFLVSPIWIVNAIYYISYGSLISEISNITACVASIIRETKKKRLASQSESNQQ